MGKFKKIEAVLIVILFCIVVIQMAAKEKTLYSINIILFNESKETPTQIAFLNEEPCILADGMVYVYRNGKWEKLIDQEDTIQRMYSGEYFCAISDSGKLIH